MKKDIVIAGVGGQGILSLAFVLDNAAMESNFIFKQTEVHGMAQRGGGVISHVRISDEEIHSDIVPKGQADILLGIEPLEVLRQIQYLSPEGTIISNKEPFINIGNYPEIEKVIATLESYPNTKLIEATKLAKDAGNKNAQNMVLLGALSNYIPFEEKVLLKWVENLFKQKGEKFVTLNFDAFKKGKEAIS